MRERTKIYLTYLAIASLTLPFLFLVKWPELAADGNSAKLISLYVGSVLGYIGLGLLISMYMLGTRSVTGLFYEDLPATLRLHSWLGKYGVVLVFAHPILHAYYYGENLLLYSWLPNISSEFERHVTLGRISFWLLLIVWVTSALIRGRIKYRPWKYIHYLAYATLPLALLHVPEVGHSYKQRGILFYWMLFVVLFVVVTLLRVRHLFGFGKATYKVVSQQKIADNIFMIRLRPNERKLTAEIGQYVYLQRSLIGEEHPFSIIDINSETGDMLLAYKVFGSYTKKLASVEPGEIMYIDGPYGNFTRQIVTPDDRTVFIAGGIGITPFMGHILKPSSAAWLFYANQNQSSAALRNIAKESLGSHYIDIFSRQQPTEPVAANTEYGYISADMISRYLDKPLGSYNYYICGPKLMMQAMRKSLTNRGVDSHNIHIEDFSF